MRARTTIFILILVLLGTAAPGKSKKRARPRMAEPRSRVMKIRGQSRALSMKLLFKSKKGKVDFAEIRRKYADEIKSTPY